MGVVIQDKFVGTLAGRERPSRCRPATVRIGYVPLIDASPLIAAEALGYFKRAGHPEKILACTQEMAGNFPEEYAAFRKAILAGHQYCESAANQLIDLLHERPFVSVSKETLANCLSNRPQTGVLSLSAQGPLIRFHAGHGNRAARERVAWILNSLTETGAVPLDPSQRKRCLEAFKD